MQSKQVKLRIARNKSFRKTPSWKRQMNAFLMATAPSSQAGLSSKHVRELTEEMTAKYKAEISQFTNRLLNWTREEWHEFIRSNNPSYAHYIKARNFMWVPPAKIAKVYGAPDLLSDLPSCECGQTVGGYNLGVVCKQCNTTVVAKTSDSKSLEQRMAERRDILKSITPEQLAQAYSARLRSIGRLRKDERLVIDMTGDTPRPVILKLTPDAEVLNKDFEGDKLNLDLPIDQRLPALRVRSIDTDLTGDELLEAVIQRHQRLYKKTPVRDEALAEIVKRGEKQINEMLRQERIRDRARFYGDPWSELRVVTQSTSDEYYNNVLRRPVVRDACGEREMTEMEWDLYKLTGVVIAAKAPVGEYRYGWDLLAAMPRGTNASGEEYVISEADFNKMLAKLNENGVALDPATVTGKQFIDLAEKYMLQEDQQWIQSFKPTTKEGE